MLIFPAQIVAQQQGKASQWPDTETIADRYVRQVDYEPQDVQSSAANSSRDFEEELSNNNHEHIVVSTESATLSKNAAARWYAALMTNLSTANIPKIVGSLAIVLGGYFGFVWLMRRLNPAASLGLPQEVVEVLGQSPFGNRKQLQLVRLGSKLLLLTNGADGIQTIGEINDPNEVDYLASLCGGKRHGRSAIAIGKATASNSSTSNELRQILRQLKTAGDRSSDSVFDA